MEDKKRSQSKEKLESVLERVSATFWPREVTLMLFLAGVVLMKLMDLFSFYNNVNWVIFALTFYLISAFLFRFLVRKQTKAKDVINLYFAYNILVELTAIILIVYLAGGVEWMGAIFLLFPVVYASIVLPRERALVVCYLASLYYVLLVVLSYLGFIPFHSYINIEGSLYLHPKYVINNILLATATIFSVGVAANLFTEILKTKTIKLEEVKKKIEEERATLEVKVAARTRELEKLAQKLEQKVKERTKELEEKIKEAEKFNALAVGREMKMIELKKKIKELEEKIKLDKG